MLYEVITRIGQTKTVQVHMMITAGTLEEQIHEMIARKRNVAEQVISAGDRITSYNVCYTKLLRHTQS